MNEMNRAILGKKPHPGNRENIVKGRERQKTDHLLVCRTPRLKRPVLVHEEHEVENHQLVDNHRSIRPKMQVFLKKVQTSNIEHERGRANHKILHKLFAHGPHFLNNNFYHSV